jgi:hypothetical protein
VSNELTTQLQGFENHDFTVKDLESIEKFKEKGMIGLASLQDTDIHRMMQLYLDGKNYRQIATLLQKDKTTILFLSQKLDWPTMRKEYLEELIATLKDKVVESKLHDQEFLLHLSLAYRKKIGKNIDKYLKTDNAEFADKIDGKDISTYLKIADMLHNLSLSDLGNPKEKSLVSLNGMGEGVTITKTGANSVEITPKGPSAVSNKLKMFADLKREQEKIKESPQKVHDISIQEQTSNKESTENEE